MCNINWGIMQDQEDLRIADPLSSHRFGTREDKFRRMIGSRNGAQLPRSTGVGEAQYGARQRPTTAGSSNHLIFVETRNHPDADDPVEILIRPSCPQFLVVMRSEEFVEIMQSYLHGEERA